MTRNTGAGMPAHAPAAEAHSPETRPQGAVDRTMRWLALAGAAVLLAAILVTLTSVTGRYGFGLPVPGDYELVEMLCGVAVFLFFPYTHAVNGNISAEFFTAALSERHKLLLDVFHDVVFALVAAILAWRLGHGFSDKLASGETSIMIRIPLWWAYGFAVLSMGLVALVCLWRIAAGIRTLRR